MDPSHIMMDLMSYWYHLSSQDSEKTGICCLSGDPVDETQMQGVSMPDTD